MKPLLWDLLHETGIHCLLVALAWSCSWLATSDDYGYGILSALFSLLAAAIIAGNFVKFIELPSLVGMIMVGFLIRNSTEFSGSSLYIIDSGWSSAIRSCALVVILLRAGLGIDIDNVRRLSWSVLRLAILPNLIEATVDALLAVTLFDMPWAFAFMLGFIISAVSPAVVVPSLLKLKEQNFGTEKGIPDLVLAAASFDDVLSISGFGISLGLGFASIDGDDKRNSIVFDIFRAPLEIALGIIGGIVFAKICSYITPAIVSHNAVDNDSHDSEDHTNTSYDIEITELPSSTSKNGSMSQRDEDDSVNKLTNEEETCHIEKDRKEQPFVIMGGSHMNRLSLLLGFGGFVYFGGKKVDFTGAGALGIIVLGIVAKIDWCKYSGNENEVKAIESSLKNVWLSVAQPWLFALIGASVSTSYLDGRFVGRGILLLFVGLIARLLTSVLCVWSGEFNMRERVFIAISWLPKATVQAALGAVVLDRARETTGGSIENSEQIELGRQILTLAALSIMITAPVGAVLIGFSGPKLLQQQQQQELL